MKKGFWISGLVVVAVLICIHAVHILCSIHDLDGAWYFSQAFSLSKGELLYNDYTQHASVLFYGMVQLPFLWLFPAHLALPLFYFALSIATVIFLSVRVQWKPSLVVLPLILLTDHTLLQQRPEAFSFLYILIGYFLITQAKQSLHQWLIACCLFLVLLFIHPANAILGTIGVLVYRKQLVPDNRRYWIVLGVLAAMGFTVLLTTNNVYLETLQHRVYSMGWQQIRRFTLYSGIGLLVLLVSSRIWFSPKAALQYFVLIAVCTLLGGSYYYTFLFIPPVLHLLEYPKTIGYMNFLWVGFAFNVVSNLVHPMMVRMENPQFCTQKENIRKAVASIDDRVHIEPYFSASLLGNNTQTRMILVSTEGVTPMDTIRSGDQIAVTHASHRQRIEHYLNQQNIAYRKSVPIRPVKGLLSLTSFYQHRSDSIGLWILTTE